MQGRALRAPRQQTRAGVQRVITGRGGQVSGRGGCTQVWDLKDLVGADWSQLGTGAREGAANPALRHCSGGRAPTSKPCRPRDPASPGPQAEIFRAFTELFQVACAKPPPLGLCHYPSSRAVYAIDLMLKWDSRPDGEGDSP